MPPLFQPPLLLLEAPQPTLVTSPICPIPTGVHVLPPSISGKSVILILRFCFRTPFVLFSLSQLRLLFRKQPTHCVFPIPPLAGLRTPYLLCFRVFFVASAALPPLPLVFVTPLPFKGKIVFSPTCPPLPASPPFLGLRFHLCLLGSFLRPSSPYFSRTHTFGPMTPISGRRPLFNFFALGLGCFFFF